MAAYTVCKGFSKKKMCSCRRCSAVANIRHVFLTGTMMTTRALVVNHLGAQLVKADELVITFFLCKMKADLCGGWGLWRVPQQQ